MTSTKLAAVRRRILNDPMFRAGLRMDFMVALAREGLLDELTPAQRDELEMALLLHDAFHLPKSGRAKREFTLAPAVRPPALPRPTPVNLGEWRAHRAR
jgi:hypothetical protein